MEISQYKLEYKNYLLKVSSEIDNEIYHHKDTVKLLSNPSTIEDMEAAIEKARVILIVWSKKHRVDSYFEFTSKQRNIKLNQIGI